jgi:G3E family GTPase
VTQERPDLSRLHRPNAKTRPFGAPRAKPGGHGIPVIVVTGPLGAGKTTLIRALLDTPEGAGSALIVNEFGEVGIDDALLREASDATVLLGNGCLCCRQSSDIEATLRGLFMDRSRGAIPSFARVIIETSGLSDPGPILTTFMTERGLAEMFALQQVVAVIDAVNGLGSLARMEESRRQIALADRVVVTKADLAPGSVKALRGAIAAINAAAPVTLAEAGRVPPDVMVAGTLISSLEERPLAAPHSHHRGIASFALTFDVPLDWPAFSLAMRTLTSLRGPDLLRAKGLLSVKGAAGPVMVHYVQHLAHPPAELKDWPGGERCSRMVFITRNIGRQAVADLIGAIERLQPQNREEENADG